MSEKEKTIAKTLASALKVLPEEKKEYLLGYAEGVNAMVGKTEEGGQDGERRNPNQLRKEVMG